jgi:hypothetical protein
MQMHIFQDLQKRYVPEGPAEFKFVKVGTEYTCSQIGKHAGSVPVEIQTPNTQKHHWWQHDDTASWVIAQQYSSATFF